MKVVQKLPRLPVLLRSSLIAGLICLGVLSAQAVPASGTTCNGTYNGTFIGNIIISTGQTCYFNAGSVVGNVKLNGGGTLNLNGASIRGNVQLQGGGNLVLTHALVTGNVEITNGGTFSLRPFTSISGSLNIQNIPPGPAQNQICGVAVAGNLQFQNNGSIVQIGAPSGCAGNAIGGNLTVQNNSAPTTLFNNTVTGNVQDQSNIAQSLAIGNTVGNNLIVQDNTAAVTLTFNNVHKNLLCQNDVLITGGSNIATQNQGCPNTPQSAGFAAIKGSNLIFVSAGGAVVLTVPLVNQSVITPTSQGNVTNVTRQWANLSDDASHAGVYTYSYSVTPADTDQEPSTTGSFTYYAASGQLWQTTAPTGSSFYYPVDTSQRFFTPDGSRVVTITTNFGSSDPVITGYDSAGHVLYQSAGLFLQLYQAQISPNGLYLLVLGSIESTSGFQDQITVTTLDTGASSNLPVNLAVGTPPVLGLAGDGRFVVTYEGSQTVLPPQ